jgi:two-component system, OmpR family, heavy metal sensor histidine kinase CusS
VFFALAWALVFAAIGWYLYEGLGKALATRSVEHLTSMTELVRHVLDEVPSVERLVSQPELVTHLLVGHSDLRLSVYGNRGDVIFTSSGTRFPDSAWASIERPAANGITTGLWRDTDHSAYRLTAARLGTDTPGFRDATILLALDVSEELRLLRAFRNNLLNAMGGGLIVAAVIGFFIASRGLRPIVRIAQSARRITASHLQERLDSEQVPDELAALVDSFNTMLARLEDSFRRLSDFSADLAHELRTPLTNLLGRTQVTLSQVRGVDEYRETLESNVEEIEQLSKLVSDMLFLAQADRAEAALELEEVDLHAESARVAEYFNVACEERGIEIDVRGQGVVRADRVMMRRAIGNLLSNAIRHSPDGERIEIEIERRAGTITISVNDRGPGIPPEQQSRIFDRFYRADPSRARHSGGSGLGLAIVRSIARLHGGMVAMSSDPGKPTVFALTLPDAAL